MGIAAKRPEGITIDEETPLRGKSRVSGTGGFGTIQGILFILFIPKIYV
jgi:hypothetical protein